MEGSSALEFKVRNCMKLCMKLLEVGGFWYNGEKESVINASYQKFIVVYAYIWSFCTYVQLYMSRNDFQEFIEILSLCIATAMFLIKSSVFIYRKKDTTIVVKSVSRNFFVHVCKITQENTKIKSTTLQQARTLVFIYSSILVSGNVIYVIVTPILTRTPEPANNTEIARVLPFKWWLPINQMVSPNYEIVYVLITVSTIFLGWLYTAVDIFFFVLMVYITGQFELLCDSLRNISRNVFKRMSRDQKNEHQLHTNQSHEISGTYNCP